MRCPTLKNLLHPTKGKTGWPWTEETEQLPDKMPDGRSWPRISIVTPSYNQGQFIEETIRSVLLQGYPNIEYIVMDGGSTDNSIEIIKKYEKHLSYWVSEKDNGQGDAINKGFSKATGSILGWLNSDDIYLPNALYHISLNLDIKKPEIIFGNCLHFVESASKSWGSDVKKAHESVNLLLCDYIIQPSSFWTKKAWSLTGILDDKIDYAFDWDWFIRAKKANVNFKPQNNYLSMYRFHKYHKTSTGGKKRFEEIATVYRKYLGVNYEKLFLKCIKHRSKISFVRTGIHILHLNRFEIEILEFIFLNLFLNFKRNEIRDILSMF